MAANRNETGAAKEGESMRHIYISMALIAAMALALMGCEADRAEIPATGTDTEAVHAGECRNLVIKGDFARAPAICRMAAETGDPSAQGYLAGMYYQGEGVTQDYAEAMQWYSKAAEQGHAGAQNNLGWMYERGRGLTQDYAEAVKWYRKAAEQGYAKAQYNLGQMYNQGNGVPQNDVNALMLFELAAAQGYDKSAKIRQTIAAKMTPAGISKAERLAHECAEKNYKGCGF
jgi:TPR repeat protein